MKRNHWPLLAIAVWSAACCSATMRSRPGSAAIAWGQGDSIVDSDACDEFMGAASGRAFLDCIKLFDSCPTADPGKAALARQQAQTQCAQICAAKHCKQEAQMCIAETVATKQRVIQKIELFGHCPSEQPISCYVVEAGICTCECKAKG